MRLVGQLCLGTDKAPGFKGHVLSAERLADGASGGKGGPSLTCRVVSVRPQAALSALRARQQHVRVKHQNELFAVSHSNT